MAGCGISLHAECASSTFRNTAAWTFAADAATGTLDIREKISPIMRVPQFWSLLALQQPAMTAITLSD